MKFTPLAASAFFSSLLFCASVANADSHWDGRKKHWDGNDYRDRDHRRGVIYYERDPVVVRPWYGTSRTTIVYGGGSNYGVSVAVDVQRALARRGYYRGPIDGDLGPGSRAAIRAYQYRHGLSVTGRISGSLLRSLGLG